VRSTAARASAGSVPAATLASYQASLDALRNRWPSSDADHLAASAGSTGCRVKVYISSPAIRQVEKPASSE
jgi:hypothetical protein